MSAPKRTPRNAPRFAAFHRSDLPMPPTMAIDVQPRAGEPVSDPSGKWVTIPPGSFWDALGNKIPTPPRT